MTSGSSKEASVATGSIVKTTYVVTNGNMGPAGSGSISVMEPEAESVTDSELNFSDMFDKGSGGSD